MLLDHVTSAKLCSPGVPRQPKQTNPWVVRCCRDYVLVWVYMGITKGNGILYDDGYRARIKAHSSKKVLKLDVEVGSRVALQLLIVWHT